MSILANSFQAFGFLVILCFMGGATEQDITTILSYIVSLVQHTVLVIMQLYYDYILAKWCKKKSPEQQQLITNVSNDEEKTDISPPHSEQYNEDQFVNDGSLLSMNIDADINDGYVEKNQTLLQDHQAPQDQRFQVFRQERHLLLR